MCVCVCVCVCVYVYVCACACVCKCKIFPPGYLLKHKPGALINIFNADRQQEVTIV